jgi:hypothetical protein
LANSFSSAIIYIIPEMDKDELITLLKGIFSNNQVKNSFECEAVLRKIKATKKITEDEFSVILNDDD